MDTGYTGFYEVVVFPVTDGRPVSVPAGTRVAQVVFLPALLPPLERVSELPETERGTNGFGSTGLKAEDMPMFPVNAMSSSFAAEKSVFVDPENDE
jgi:hypothetical protein